MTMKEQERKALEQIKKIVAGLGEDSYIGIAFEGCFEIAEENIENDFACSMKQRAEAAERKAEALAATAIENEKRGMEARNHAAALEDNLHKTEKYYEGQITDLKAKVSNLEDRLQEATDSNVKNFRDANELSLQLSHMEKENIKLKAKLFDLLFKD